MRFSFATILFIMLGVPAIAARKINLIIRSGIPITRVEVNDYSFTEKHVFGYSDTLSFTTEQTRIDMYTIGCIVNGKKIWTQMWLDTGLVTICGHIDSDKLKIDTVINSPFYYYAKNYQKKYSTIVHLQDSVQVNDYLLDGIRVNSNNPFCIWVALYYLNYNQNNKVRVALLKESISELIHQFSWFRLASEVGSRMDNILTNDQIKVDEFIGINEREVKDKIDLSGARYFVLDFWFLSCASCLKEHVAISRNWDSLFKTNIQVVSICTDSYKHVKEWKDYLKKNKYYWPNYLQLEKNGLSEKLAIETFPYYIIIDKVGNILGRYNSYSDVLRSLKLLDHRSVRDVSQGISSDR